MPGVGGREGQEIEDYKFNGIRLHCQNGFLDYNKANNSTHCLLTRLKDTNYPTHLQLNCQSHTTTFLAEFPSSIITSETITTLFFHPTLPIMCLFSSLRGNGQSSRRQANMKSNQNHKSINGAAKSEKPEYPPKQNESYIQLQEEPPIYSASDKGVAETLRKGAVNWAV